MQTGSGWISAQQPDGLEHRDKNESARVLNTIEKATQLTWAQIYQDPGLKWERSTQPPVPLPPDVNAVYSIRVTQACRAVVFRQEHFLLLLIAEDHDRPIREAGSGSTGRVHIVDEFGASAGIWREVGWRTIFRETRRTGRATARGTMGGVTYLVRRT